MELSNAKLNTGHILMITASDQRGVVRRCQCADFFYYLILLLQLQGSFIENGRIHREKTMFKKYLQLKKNI